MRATEPRWVSSRDGYALVGELDRAHDWIERAMLVDPDNLNMRYNFACVLASYTDDKEGAIKLLKSLLPVALETYGAAVRMTDPDLDPIRDDPRVIKLMNDARKRLGIAEPQPATSPAQP